MTFNLVNRRIHLYLALFLLPWTFMYGISSLPFSHSFRGFYDDGVPQWTKRFDRPYDRPVPEGADVRELAAQILADVDLEGSFGANRPHPQQLNIYLFNFWESTRLTYYIDEGRLLAEDRRFRWDQFLTGIHARGGFQQHSLLADAWAVMVDIVCVGFLVWIASGLYMWWQLSQTRLWGALAMAGGLLSFLSFLFAL